MLFEEQLRKILKELPSDALPDPSTVAKRKQPRKNFTLYSPHNSAIVEVQLKSRVFYMKKKHDDTPPGMQPTVSWGKHGGPHDAWKFVKNVVGWEKVPFEDLE